MKLMKPKEVRQYGYQIEGYFPDGEVSCVDMEIVKATSFDDAVSKVKELMKEKNKGRRREGLPEYSEITMLELCDFSREKDE